MKIGICGAGVAGPALAFFLRRSGHQPTLIERARSFRAGGYILDFWGVGYSVIERMSLIGQVRDRGYQIREIRLVGDDGRKVGGFSAGVFDRMTHGRFTSVPRGDLAGAIFDAVKDEVETVFGDTVASIAETGGKVEIELASGAHREFDMMVGVDGLHSKVRQLVWGEQERYERPLGYYVAAFRTVGYPHRQENVYVTFSEPGRSMSRVSLRDDRTLFLLVFSASHLPDGEPQNVPDRKATLRRVFGKSGWEASAILDALEEAEDLYFDRVSQIEVPSWSQGRTVLVGDAAACPSLLAGEGSSLAIAEAYVLAGELKRAEGDIETALAAYETRMRPFLARKQKAARKFAPSFAPETAFGVWLRRAATKLMVVPPIADLLIGNSVGDDFELPDYAI